MMSIDKKVIVISDKSTLNNVIRELVNHSKPYFGFVCIVNNRNQLQGVFNSGFVGNTFQPLIEAQYFAF